MAYTQCSTFVIHSFQIFVLHIQQSRQCPGVLAFIVTLDSAANTSPSGHFTIIPNDISLFF